MTSHDLQRVQALTPELLRVLGEELGWLLNMEHPLRERIQLLAAPEDVDRAAKRSRALLKGSLLVYLFALWQSHMPSDIKQWMSKDEVMEFEAYEHVRDSVAHAPIKVRADHRRKRTAFETFYPFAGVVWDRATDTIEIADSNVVHEFVSYMLGMSAQLTARLYGGVKPSAA